MSVWFACVFSMSPILALIDMGLEGRLRLTACSYGRSQPQVNDVVTSPHVFQWLPPFMEGNSAFYSVVVMLP